MQQERKYLVVANWKCNGTTDFVRDIVSNLINDLEYDTRVLDFIVLPGMLHINLAKARIDDKIMIGSQNVSMYSGGAYTGEVSAEQLADYEIEWVLIGHSERRKQGEDQEIINQKVIQARNANLGLIYCVGENLEQREAEESQEVIFSQLASIKEKLDETEWRKVVIAYEPIWALNTGKISSADQTQEAIEMIRQWLHDNCSQKIANQTQILYAGPVTETNTENLIKLHGVDGFLIGSTSCKPVFRSIFDMVHAQAKRDIKH
jgi:triosephosphate isomerase